MNAVSPRSLLAPRQCGLFSAYLAKRYPAGSPTWRQINEARADFYAGRPAEIESAS